MASLLASFAWPVMVASTGTFKTNMQFFRHVVVGMSAETEPLLQVWYEWALVEPSATKIHNASGSAYAIKLFVD